MPIPREEITNSVICHGKVIHAGNVYAIRTSIGIVYRYFDGKYFKSDDKNLAMVHYNDVKDVKGVNGETLEKAVVTPTKGMWYEVSHYTDFAHSTLRKFSHMAIDPAEKTALNTDTYLFCSNPNTSIFSNNVPMVFIASDNTEWEYYRAPREGEFIFGKEEF